MITIFQGNDKNFFFYRKDTKGDVITTVPLAMWFTVKNTLKDEAVRFQKTLHNGIEQMEDGAWIVHIYANDTANLKNDKYVYDVKIRDENGYLFTIIEPQDFIVKPVVTRVSNQGG